MPQVTIYYDDTGINKEVFVREIPFHDYGGEDLLRHVMGCAWEYPNGWFDSLYWSIDSAVTWKDEEVVFDLVSRSGRERKHIRITGDYMPRGPW